MDTVPFLLTLDHFAPLVGQVFRAAEAPTFTLVAAEPLEHSMGGVERAPFVLTFHADTPEPVQGMRRFDLPGIGPTDIFLVPAARVGTLIAYDAVFN